MQFIITDLEWNGSYTRKTHGYFNEIIEIGAVKVDESLGSAETFHAVIRPELSRKLSSIVTDLTNITEEELKDGISFCRAVELFKEWIGTDEAVLATWSNTDLLVMMENFRYYYRSETIPFATHYVDLQRYCQQLMDVDSGHQLGLSHAAQRLGISEEGMALHRALDDSILTARVLKHLYDADAIRPHILKMDRCFYERIHFKPYFIKDIEHPAAKPREFRFRCEDCGRNLKQKSTWRFYNHAFHAELVCGACRKKYIGRVQLRQLYDSVEIKRKLLEKKPKETASSAETAVTESSQK